MHVKNFGGEMKSYRLGILGTGRIASRFVKDAWQEQGFELTAVYNPNLDSARRFVSAHADKLKKERMPGRGFGYADSLQGKEVAATNDWEEFLSRVDAVYIASPHDTHFEYAKKLLRAGKHVLCEKPLVLKAAEAEELYHLARENRAVLMEALKTAYCPGFQALLAEVQSGRIGEVREVEACFTRLTPTNLREQTDLSCGGSFTELGSYVLYPVMKLLGTEYQNVSFYVMHGVNGLDEYTRVFFDYGEKFASCKTGLGVKSEGQMIISGTKGYIIVQAPWWITRKYEVHYEDPNRIECYEFPYRGSGLQYECGEFYARIWRIEEGGCSLENVASGDGALEEALGVDGDTGVDGGLTPKKSVAMAAVMESFLEREKGIRFDAARRLQHVLQERPMVFWAHRGCSMQYPENSLEAFLEAANTPGTAGIELDVQLTKDGEVVVFHDENVARVTDGDRKVAEYTLAELKELWIAPGDEKRTRIPTLREVLECMAPYCRDKGFLINIELKTSVIHYEGIEEKTSELVKEYGLEPYIVYSSFWAESCKRMKDLNPANKTGMLAMLLSDCIRWGRYAGVDALHPWIGGMDCEIPEDMKGMPVRAWNMEEPFYKDGRVLRERHMEKYAMFGVTEIITNVPEMYERK